MEEPWFFVNSPTGIFCRTTLITHMYKPPLYNSFVKATHEQNATHKHTHTHTHALRERESTILTQTKQCQLKFIRVSPYLQLRTHKGSKEKGFSLRLLAVGVLGGGACTVIGRTHSHLSLSSIRRQIQCLLS